MSGSATIGTEQGVLGHTLGFAPMAFPAQVFVGLCAAAMPPSETVQGIEVFGGGYARVPAQFALIDTPANIAANVTSMEWPIAAAAWGTLGFFELWDAATGGNRLYWGALIDPITELATTITVLAGKIVRFSAGTLAVQAATGTGGTGSVGAYLPLAGGTLTGPLTLAADPVASLGAATKQYVDAHSGTGGGGGYLPINGGTLTGMLTLAGAPIGSNDAVTKNYVDLTQTGGPFLPLSGGTVLGPLNWTATGATTSRAAQDRTAEIINVKDYGAVLNGTTDDTAAWFSARAKALADGSIVVPRGRQFVNTAPTTGPATPVLWRYDGNYLGAAGTTPVSGMGIDVVETFYGGKYFARGNSFAGVAPVLRIDQVINHSTGIAGTNSTSLALNTSASGASPEGVFGFNSTIINTKTAGGDVVAVSGYANRNPGAGVLNQWGANFYAQDTTNQPSSAAGSAVGIEVGVIVNADDDEPPGLRVVIDAVGAKANSGGPNAVVQWGIRCGPSAGLPGVTFGRHYSAFGPFNSAAFSTENAVQAAGANAIWLATGHRIALDTAGTSGAAHTTLSSDGTTATLKGSLHIDAAAGGWSSVNVGKQLLLTGPASDNPGLGIADVNGGNIIGIFNTSGTLGIAGMPAYSDSTNAPNYIALLSVTTGITFAKPLTLNPLPTNAANDPAAATAGVPVGGVYRNGNAMMVRVA
jgi:hypothetical protein